MPVTFDTFLAYANKLKAVGVPEKQAEVQAEALAGIVEDNLATKRDLKELEANLKAEMSANKADTIKWVAGMMIAQAAAIATLLKLL
ncbi:MAG: DUF1640 domain-containing protein [Nitrospinae bacterium]|nr:DUF1640 domain-containing protein [Nitrospinota bacterium]